MSCSASKIADEVVRPCSPGSAASSVAKRDAVLDAAAREGARVGDRAASRSIPSTRARIGRGRWRWSSALAAADVGDARRRVAPQPLVDRRDDASQPCRSRPEHRTVERALALAEVGAVVGVRDAVAAAVRVEDRVGRAGRRRRERRDRGDVDGASASASAWACSAGSQKRRAPGASASSTSRKPPTACCSSHSRGVARVDPGRPASPGRERVARPQRAVQAEPPPRYAVQDQRADRPLEETLDEGVPAICLGACHRPADITAATEGQAVAEEILSGTRR